MFVYHQTCLQACARMEEMVLSQTSTVTVFCHINKVMAVAFTAFAFDSSVENGGHGVKIGLYRVQAARVAQRDVRESRLDENGNRRYDGDIV